MSLTKEQQNVIDGVSAQKLIVAGPGTGKTTIIVEFVKRLIDSGVLPEEITILTFTKSNTSDFTKKLLSEVGGEKMPRINNIHSFALQELVVNHSAQNFIPIPIRIADDFEENLIYEDIKNILNIDKNKVRELFSKLSAGWENLNADKTEWEETFSPDVPKFIGIYKEHRKIYGYTLRSELVYRYKQFIETTPEYKPKKNIKYLIVDEYQDLNRCDQKVILLLAKRTDCQLLCSGDDDQSIYSFRYAYPEGIGLFKNDYPNCSEYKLEECFRCDKNILGLALNVIGQDYNRIPKTLKSISSLGGIVKFYKFANENIEAQKISELVKFITEKKEINPSDILILLRNDSKKQFSSPIVKSLNSLGFEVNSLDWDTIWDSEFGQYLFSLIKFKIDENDSLAIRAVLQLTPNLGSTTYSYIYNKARQNNSTFAKIVSLLINSEEQDIPNKTLLIKTLFEIKQLKVDSQVNLLEQIKGLASLVPSKFNKDEDLVLNEIKGIIEKEKISELKQLLLYVNSLIDSEEAIIDENKVNIMTMHKAKGLSSQVVIMPALEDEIYRENCNTDEERRLLYVSLTRAKNILILSYCNKRSAPQGFSGTGHPNRSRKVSRFLQDIPLPAIENGDNLFNKK